MNSPPFSDGGPDRIDNDRIGSHQASDVRMEGGGRPSPGSIRPSKEAGAASALTSLVKKPTVEDVGEDFDLPQRFTKSGRKKAIPFPLKLMKVLSQKEYTDIITWLPDGKSFTIIRPKSFVTEILPGFFKSSKYSSFTRKLHRWGFQRHLRGEDAGAFFHKHFIRGRLDLVDKMTCHKDDGSSMDMQRACVPSVNHRETGGGSNFPRDPIVRAVGTPANVMSHDSQLQLQQQLQQLQQMQQQLQSLQQQQQQNIVMHQQQEQLELMRSQVQHPMQAGQRLDSRDVNSVDRLNAAIELEVSRRLTGRMHGGNDRFIPQSMPVFNNSDRLALSRQALAMNLVMPSQAQQFNVGPQFNTQSFQGLQNLLGGQDTMNIRHGISRGDVMMDSEGPLQRF